MKRLVKFLQIVSLVPAGLVVLVPDLVVGMRACLAEPMP
jgi:hypothetical protein